MSPTIWVNWSTSSRISIFLLYSLMYVLKLSFRRKSRRTKSMVAGSSSYLVKCFLVQVKYSIATTENGTVADISQTYDDVFKLLFHLRWTNVLFNLLLGSQKLFTGPFERSSSRISFSSNIRVASQVHILQVSSAPEVPPYIMEKFAIASGAAHP